MLHGSQTTLVPAGGGTVVELQAYVPSTLVLVDHALSRAFDKGAVGHIVISGAANPEIFQEVGDDAAEEDASDGVTAGEEEPYLAEEIGEVADVRILEGSSEFQDMGAADEFAAEESPGDYSTNELVIPVGTTVTWTNDDGVMHTVTAADGSFDSGFLEQGDTWSYTFDEPGEFEYFCSPHPWMRAKVIVEN